MLSYPKHTAGPSDPAFPGVRPGGLGWAASSPERVVPLRRVAPVADGLTDAVEYYATLLAQGRQETLGSLQGGLLEAPVADGGTYADQ